MVPTVWGIPLEPGERVLYYSRKQGNGERIFMFVMGIVLLPVLVGIWLLHQAITYDKSTERVVVITDRRMLGITNAHIVLTTFRLNEISNVKRVVGAKNQWVVSGSNRGMSTPVMTFDASDHPFQVLEPILRQLGNPTALPNARFEP